MWFVAISGLKINLDKSEFLMGMGDDAEDLAMEIGCKVGRLLLIWVYLWVLPINQWL